MRNAYILVALTLAAVASPAQEPSANEILTKTAATYATCRTYYDEGSINSGFFGFRNGYFRTTFVRPFHLAFELWPNREDMDRKSGWVVWKSDDSIKSWVPSNIRPGAGTRKEAPLDIALNGLAPPSAGASLYVPPLLLPSLFRTADLLASMSEVRVAGEDKIDGHEAFRIEAKLWDKQQVKLWIDKTRYVILKASRKLVVGSEQIESTVYFKPVLNADIPPEKLLLKVPGDSVVASRPSRAATSSVSSAPTLAPRREFGWSLTHSANARSSAVKSAGAEDDVVRVDTDLVVASVLVLDSDGKVVNGLTKDDFVVKEGIL